MSPRPIPATSFSSRPMCRIRRSTPRQTRPWNACWCAATTRPSSSISTSSRSRSRKRCAGSTRSTSTGNGLRALVDRSDVLRSAVPRGWGALCCKSRGSTRHTRTLDRESEHMDETKLHEFVGQMLSDLGGAASVALVRIGDALGLYKTLHAKGPMTIAEMAAASGVNQRYLREWLSHHAASNYLSYDPQSEKFTLPEEQAMVFAVD